jgi:hypothetical protein
MSDVDDDPKDDDETDSVILLREAYRALTRLQVNLDNVQACLNKGDANATHHVAIAKANAKEAQERVTQAGKIQECKVMRIDYPMYDRIDPDWKLGPDDMVKVTEEERVKWVS